MSQVLLVRHGQASWGADDYDVLSERGVEQSGVLGAALAARGIEPTVLVSGAMRRHHQTAAAAVWWWRRMAPETSTVGSMPRAARAAPRTADCSIPRSESTS